MIKIRKNKNGRKNYDYDEVHKFENGVLLKMCTMCLEWFPCNDENFHKNSKNKSDGLNPNCKVCWINKTKKYIKENPDKKKKWDYKDFEKPERKIYFRDLSQKRRDNGKYDEWRYNTEAGRLSLISDTRKRRHKKHKINKKEWLACKDYFKNENGEQACAYCELPISSHKKMYKGVLKHQDLHKEHWDDEGLNDLSNCVPSCHTCNSEKGFKGFELWYTEENPKYDIDRKNKILKWIFEDYKQFIVIKKSK